jgi:hypothetical protein
MNLRLRLQRSAHCASPASLLCSVYVFSQSPKHRHLAACTCISAQAQVLSKDCYFTSSQAAELVAAFSYGEDKVDAAVKVGLGASPHQ